jgi:hypothetical protein
MESTEDAERLFIEDFDTWDMTGYYLYSKLLGSGVSRHIGTGGYGTTAIAAIGNAARIARRVSGMPSPQAVAVPAIVSLIDLDKRS